MRGVEREVEEKGFVLLLFDETHALTEPDVGAVAFKLLKLAVSLVDVVKIVVAPVVGGLADAAATMPDDVLEAPVLRAMRRVVAQMPLADHAGDVASVGQEVCQSLFVPMHQGATGTGPEGSRVAHVVSGHERSPGGRAEGADMEIGEAHRFGVKAVEVGGLEDGVAVTGEITVALVVGHDEDDIGTLGETMGSAVEETRILANAVVVADVSPGPVGQLEQFGKFVRVISGEVGRFTNVFLQMIELVGSERSGVSGGDVLSPSVREGSCSGPSSCLNMSFQSP